MNTLNATFFFLSALVFGQGRAAGWTYLVSWKCSDLQYHHHFSRPCALDLGYFICEHDQCRPCISVGLLKYASFVKNRATHPSKGSREQMSFGVHLSCGGKMNLQYELQATLNPTRQEEHILNQEVGLSYLPSWMWECWPWYLCNLGWLR